MKNLKNSEKLKASLADLSDKSIVELKNDLSVDRKSLSLDPAVTVISWPVAVYKFVKNRSGEMFK